MLVVHGMTQGKKIDSHGKIRKVIDAHGCKECIAFLYDSWRF